MPPPKGRSGFRAGRKQPGHSNEKGGKVKKSQQVPPAPKFKTTRLAEKEDETTQMPGDEIPDQDSEHTDEDDEQGASDESDDEEVGPSIRPYLSLMQSLMAGDPHKAKRRKLHHAADEKQGGPVAQGAEKRSERERESDDDDNQDVDLAEEPEEDSDAALAEEMLDDDDDDDDGGDDGGGPKETADPFKVHFADPDEEAMRRRAAAIQAGHWHTQRIDSGSSRTFFSVPKAAEESDDQRSSLPGPVSGIKDLKLKKKLHDAMLAEHPDFDSVEQTLAPLLFNYNDLLYCGRTFADGASIRRILSLHALNHIFKTRDRVIKNNERLARAAADVDLELRDQGFTRPKVLMLLPTRNSCARMVEAIRAICAPEQQESYKRFDEAYVDTSAERFGDDKPDDFRDLFAGNDGDMFRVGIRFTRKSVKFFAEFYSSDLIIASPLGLRMAIGSEEEEGGGDGGRRGNNRDDDPRAKKKKGLDFDFLSSIELVVLDQADALLMQNWEHVEFIMDRLNAQPRDAHGCDFSRVRNWSLDGLARHFRQTVVLSAFDTPELAGLLRTHCVGWRGKARVQQPAEHAGVIQHLRSSDEAVAVGLKIRQTFSRFDAHLPAADPDARFAYFTKAVVPTLVSMQKKDRRRGTKDKESTSSSGGARGTLVFIPSYLDYVRVRNYLASDAAAVAALSFGAVSEYAGLREASRARSHFASGRHALLLYTERAHHFRRYRAFPGVRRIVMYGLPDNPVFYQEVAGGFLAAQARKRMMAEGGQGPGGGEAEAKVRVMFSKYDAIKLERVVGSKRVGKMIRDRGDTFEFV